MEMLNIANYRQFIRFYLVKRSLRGRGEIGKLAKFIRVHSTFVSQVLAGTKDFNIEQSYATTEYLQLNKIEKKFFLLLVLKDRASTKEVKNYFMSEIEELKSTMLSVSNHLNKHRVLSETDGAIFYSTWLYSAIRLYCSIGSGKTLEEICHQFHLGRKKALSYVDFLEKIGLIFLQDERYKLGEVHTNLSGDSPFIIKHHMNWRVKALQRQENTRVEEMAFTAPMSLSKKDFLKIREKLLASIKEVIELAKESEAEDVAFLNIDWFWIEPPNE